MIILARMIGQFRFYLSPLSIEVNHIFIFIFSNLISTDFILQREKGRFRQTFFLYIILEIYSITAELAKLF